MPAATPLLKRRAFRTLIFGQAVSSLGDWTGTLALMYLVLELSGSTTAVGGVLVLRLLPSAVGAPFATRVVSRWPRRQVMMASDVIRTGMALALPIIPWLGWVYFWAFMIEVVGLAFLPARDAAIPVLIEEGEEGEDGPRTGTLEVANGVTMGTSFGMIPAGAGVFALILWSTRSLGLTGLWPYLVVFWLDAATYLISYFAIRTLPDLGPSRSSREADRTAEGPARKSGDGFFQALRLPAVRAVVPGVAVVALGLGALFSLGVIFVRNVLGAGPWGFGLLVALFGVGAAVGLTILSRRRTGNLIPQVRTAAALQGVVITTMGLVASEAWAFVGAVLFGAAATGALVGGITYMQRSLTGTRRNVALTAFHAVLRFGLALAALASGLAADLLGTIDLGALGSLEPTQTVLAVSGLIVIAGTFLIHSPVPEVSAEADGGAEADVDHGPDARPAEPDERPDGRPAAEGGPGGPGQAGSGSSSSTT